MNSYSLPTVMAISCLISFLIGFFYLALSKASRSDQTSTSYRFMAVSYVCYGLRLALQLLPADGTPAAGLANEVLYIGWVFALWLGVRAYGQPQRVPLALWIVPALLVLWNVAARGFDLSFLWRVIPPHFAGAGLFWLAGLHLWRLRRERENWGLSALAILLWLHGLSTASYPFTRDGWFAPYGFTLFALLSPAIGMGLMLATLIDEQRVLLAEMRTRRLAEEASRRAQDFTATLLAKSPAGVVVYEGDTGNCVLANEAMAEIVGGTVDELRRQNFRNLACWSEAGLEGLAESALHDNLVGHKEMTVHTSFGKIVSLDGFISRVDIDGKVHLMFIALDIAERKRAEEELRRYRDRLEDTVQQRTAELQLARDAADSANKAKSVFLANMSHELRTPLNAILGFCNMMRRDPELTKNQRESLDIINRSGEHLLSLINDVLDVAKIEAGRVQLEVAPFDLEGVVRDVTKMMQIRAEEKGLRLLFDQSSTFPRYVKGDESRVRQIIINLINNAVKFTDQGAVTVRLGAKNNSGTHLLIEVEDTGPGIRPDDQQRLFEPFVQLSEGDAKQGSGLGLTITRQFVQMMGGNIAVESTLGKGALFRVELPLAPASSAEIFGPDIRDSGEVIGLAPGQPRYRIMIVEDQRENQLLLSRLMTDIGMDVKVAENGKRCLELFEDWRPDLIWMDNEMPLMDGIEATRMIRRLPAGKSVKIVAVTASAFKEQQREMLDAGMDDLVRKPYRFGEIYRCLACQLGVEFRYRDGGKDSEIAYAELTPEMLADLPAPLRRGLRDALESLDGKRIASVIRQIGELDAPLGRTLSGRAECFDYPSILAALDTNEASANG